MAVSYNPFSIEHRANPYPAYAALRKEAPVLRLEGMEMFVVSRYQEVVEVLQNPDRYSSMAMHRLMMGSMTGGIANIAKDEAQSRPDPKAVEAIRKQTDGTGIDPVEMLIAAQYR